MTNLIAADAGVRQLQSRYMDAVWRRDYQAFGDCFTRDAEWHIAGRVIQGQPACVAFLQEFMPLFDRVRMTMGTPILEVGDGWATGRTDVLEHNILKDRTRHITIGAYYDRCVEEDGRWRFASHFYQLYYIGPPDMSGDFHEVANFGPPPAMPTASAATVTL
jgi:hypothetical protein